MLVKLMEGVEDIPEVVLTEGLPWNWQTLSRLPRRARRARHYDIDIAAQVPHAALRVYVMGERGAEPRAGDRGRPQPHGRAGRRRDLGPARSAFPPRARIAPQDPGGRPHPDIARGRGGTGGDRPGDAAAGAGWMQMISDFDDPDKEFGMLRRVAEGSGRPMTLSLLQREHAAEAMARAARQDGGGERRRAAHEGQVMGAPDRHHARLRNVAEPVHRPAELARDHGSAVRRTAASACAIRHSAPALLSEETDDADAEATR